MVQEKSLLDAMGKVSDSINSLIRFVKALDIFLFSHKIGRAEFELLTNPDMFPNRGYDFAVLHVNHADGEGLLYLHFYTNGTTTGENLSNDGPDIDCTWNEALREILRTIGVLNFPPFTSEKIAKAIEALE